MTGTALTRALLASPVVLILRETEPETAVAIAEAAAGAGVACVEATIETARGRAALRALTERRLGIEVGAGTVRTVDDLAFAVDAGAAFTVAPGLSIDVVRAARQAGVPHLPGVATATEMLAAAGEGLTLVKAFPASALGPSWIRAMRGPFPDVRVVATGGVSPQTAPEYLDAGAAGVGISVRGELERLFAALRTSGLLDAR